ncbi:MAG: phytanoyl-CoA dioxygenase family protein [Acidimicrobiales bacterium]|jgi:ectoine hydroxylase-related dioxygenase (phytanoyl-CoA dioxygenase family)
MSTLSEQQVEAFWRDGYLVADNAVTDRQLAALQAELAAAVEESRVHVAPFGAQTIDGRPRYDIAPDHSASAPALRRMNNPSEVSDAFRDVMEQSATVDMVADLIGSAKFHHDKVNLKLPGGSTQVAWHQDFAYTPHTNDDVITALIMVDDMNTENGCLKAVPGSHRGPVYSLFAGDTFTGFIDPEVVRDLVTKEHGIYGSAGSVCLMHTRLAHGSDANLSDRSRTLYICVYTANDAFPLAANPMPNPDEGRVLRGEPTRAARLTAATVELPAQPKRASFFDVQAEGAEVSG